MTSHMRLYCHAYELNSASVSDFLMHNSFGVYVSTIYSCVILLLLGSVTNYVYPLHTVTVYLYGFMVPIYTVLYTILSRVCDLS